jgi:hypothetical protein
MRLVLQIFAVFLLAAGALTGGPAHANKKVALVIGNGNYAEAPLKNPANDARAIAATLRKQGFEVLLKENATKTQMNEIVADFGEKLTEGDTALFFFAGHGMQVQGRNYLIPVDARITSEQRVRLETLDVDAVLDQMAAARARVSLVILDACRNNPFERRFRSVGGGLAQINAPEGTMIAYATAPGKVAADGEGANGLYTQELLRALGQPGLKVEDVFKQVRIGVARASNGAQVPWEASSLTGDFYFQPAVATPVVVSPPPPVAAPVVDREAMFWDSVKSSTDVAELQAYLETYPNGTFVPLARARVRSLEASRQQAAVQARTPAPASAPAPTPVPTGAAVPTPAPAAPTPQVQQPSQQLAAASPTARAVASFNGRLAATVPNGVLIVQSPYTYLTIEGGSVQFFSSVFGGSGPSGSFNCSGSGELDSSGAFSNVEVLCRSAGTWTRTLAGGILAANGTAQVTFESANGKKTDVLFK